MDTRYENNAEHELDMLFPIEMLREINIEFMNIPGNDCWDGGYFVKGDGTIILSIKSNPREKLKNALQGAILLGPENYNYAFGNNSVMDMKKESEIDGLAEKIISEPFSPISEEMGYMIKKAEIEYIERLGGNFKKH